MYKWGKYLFQDENTWFVDLRWEQKNNFLTPQVTIFSCQELAMQY